VEVSDNVWDLVNFRKETAGFLATAGADLRCDIACFSSLQLSDLETMTMLIGDNRTLANLRVNPNAAFIVAKGDTMEDAQGCRVYLRVKEIIEEGPVIEKGRQLVEQSSGAEAVGNIKAFVSFEVVETRPLIDTGQGI
jgi:hypothetical protein